MKKIEAELSPGELMEWEAAIDVLGLADVPRQIARLTTLVANYMKTEDTPTIRESEMMRLIRFGSKAKKRNKYLTPEESLQAGKARAGF